MTYHFPPLDAKERAVNMIGERQYQDGLANFRLAWEKLGGVDDMTDPEARCYLYFLWGAEWALKQHRCKPSEEK